MIVALRFAATSTIKRPTIVPPMVSVNQCAPCQIRANPVTLAPIAQITPNAIRYARRSVRRATMNANVPIRSVAVVA